MGVPSLFIPFSFIIIIALSSFCSTTNAETYVFNTSSACVTNLYYNKPACDWSLAMNWNNGVIPVSAGDTDVIISASNTPFAVSMTAVQFDCSTLTISGNVIFSLSYSYVSVANLVWGKTSQVQLKHVSDLYVSNNVTSKGLLNIDSSLFTYPGILSIPNITLNGNLTVQSLKTGTIMINENAYVNGDIYLNGNLFLNAIYSIFGGLTATPVLEIDGNYVQNYGFINVQYSSLTEEPALKVTKDISISSVDVEISVSSYFINYEFERFVLAHSLSKSISSHSFFSLNDYNNPERKLVADVSKGYIYVEPKQPNFFARHWILITYFAIVGLITLIVFIIMIRRTRDKLAYVPSVEPHYFLKHGHTRFLPFSTKNNRTCCNWIFWTITLLVTLPFIMSGTIFTLLLALLIPLGFFFGLIEHKFLKFWGLIVLLCQIGGLLDLFADIALLGKIVVIYVEGQLNIADKGDGDISEFTDDELVLFYARIIITVVGSFASMITIAKFIVAVRETKQPVTTQKNTNNKNQVSTPKKNTTTTQKKTSSSSTSLRLPPLVAIPVLILTLASWKVVLFTVRLYLLWIVLGSIFRKGRIVQSVQRKVQWLESILYIDLMFSGIPLGILTCIQLFYFERDEEFEGDQIFELMKLSALAVDLVAASFLFYYIFVGLINKIPLLSHHDHGHSDSDSHSDSHSHSIHVQEEKKKVDETAPLIAH